MLGMAVGRYAGWVKGVERFEAGKAWRCEFESHFYFYITSNTFIISFGLFPKIDFGSHVSSFFTSQSHSFLFSLSHLIYPVSSSDLTLSQRASLIPI